MFTSVEKFKAFDTNRLLKIIAKQDPKPIVTIYLSNNICLYGFIISLSENDFEGNNVCFQSEQSKSIIYFNAAHILAIEVHHPDNLASELSDGEIPRALNEKESISQLQLKRWIKEQVDGLAHKNENFSIELPEQELSNTDRLNLKDITNMLLSAIKNITSDTMGQAAWCEIESLKLEHSIQKINITKIGNNVILATEYKKALVKKLAVVMENLLLAKR